MGGQSEICDESNIDVAFYMWLGDPHNASPNIDSFDFNRQIQNSNTTENVFEMTPHAKCLFDSLDVVLHSNALKMIQRIIQSPKGRCGAFIHQSPLQSNRTRKSISVIRMNGKSTEMVDQTVSRWERTTEKNGQKTIHLRPPWFGPFSQLVRVCFKLVRSWETNKRFRVHSHHWHCVADSS